MSDMPDIKDFEALGLRIGTIVRCEDNVGARDPAFRLWIDIGDEDLAQSSAKLTDRYVAKDLVDRQVAVVTGFAPIRVGGFQYVRDNRAAVLIRTDTETSSRMIDDASAA